MHGWMRKHRAFLEEVDAWFGEVRARHDGQMLCGRGCALCCHGLFDISLPDALLVAEAFAALSPPRLGLRSSLVLV